VTANAVVEWSNVLAVLPIVAFKGDEPGNVIPAQKTDEAQRPAGKALA